MSRVRYTQTVVCDGCGVEISWAPVLMNKRVYCCLDCAEGRPCQCDFPVEELEQAQITPALVTT